MAAKVGTIIWKRKIFARKWWKNSYQLNRCELFWSETNDYSSLCHFHDFSAVLPSQETARNHDESQRFCVWPRRIDREITLYIAFDGLPDSNKNYLAPSCTGSLKIIKYMYSNHKCKTIKIHSLWAQWTSLGLSQSSPPGLLNPSHPLETKAFPSQSPPKPLHPGLCLPLSH